MPRRWNETRSVEDEVAWLREQLRHGVANESQLYLSAWRGSQAARTVLGDLAPPDSFRLISDSKVQRALIGHLHHVSEAERCAFLLELFPPAPRVAALIGKAFQGLRDEAGRAGHRIPRLD